jgi:hypothetical protein
MSAAGHQQRRYSSDWAHAGLSDDQLAVLLASHDMDDEAEATPSGSPPRATGGDDTHDDNDDSSSDGDDGHTAGGEDASSVLHVPALRIAWAALLGVLARRPPGNHVPLTLDIAVTTVRALRCVPACAVGLTVS